MNFLKKIKPAYILIILLSLISQRYIYNVVLYPGIEMRIISLHSALRGEMQPPYQYRILKPAVSVALDKVFSVFISNEMDRYKLIFKLLLFVGFFFLFLVYYKFLRNFYTDTTAIIGLLLLQTAIPLTVTDNCWEEGDFIALFFYLLAFYCMFKNKDYFIPLIVGIGTLNREQTVFLMVFYAIYLYEQKRLFTFKSLVIIASSGIIYVIVFLGLRLCFGFKPNPYIGAHVPMGNIEHWSSILRLWIEQIAIFVITSIMVYKRSRKFFQLSFLSLIPFTILFFFYGVMGELGKFLPALIILITMSLQLFNNEYTFIPSKQNKEVSRGRLKFR